MSPNKKDWRGAKLRNVLKYDKRNDIFSDKLVEIWIELANYCPVEQRGREVSAWLDRNEARNLRNRLNQILGE